MQPTAGRRIASLYFMKTPPLQVTLARASGGWSYSRWASAKRVSETRQFSAYR